MSLGGDRACAPPNPKRGATGNGMRDRSADDGRVSAVSRSAERLVVGLRTAGLISAAGISPPAKISPSEHSQVKWKWQEPELVLR